MLFHRLLIIQVLLMAVFGDTSSLALGSCLPWLGLQWDSCTHRKYALTYTDMHTLMHAQGTHADVDTRSPTYPHAHSLGLPWGNETTYYYTGTHAWAVDGAVVALCYIDDGNASSILDYRGPRKRDPGWPSDLPPGRTGSHPRPHIQGHRFPAGTLALSDWVMLTGMQTWPVFPSPYKSAHNRRLYASPEASENNSCSSLAGPGSNRGGSGLPHPLALLGDMFAGR